MKMQFAFWILFFSNSFALAEALNAKDAIHTHVYRVGETFTYEYDDTDITYCADVKGGIPVATNPTSIQELQIEAKIDILKSESGLSHKLSLLPRTRIRQGDASNFSGTAFDPVSKLVKNYPAQLSYSYPNEGFALTHLFDLFKTALNNGSFMADPVAQLLFFKMQDVHQMQDSALEVHDGIMPGDSYLIPSHETPGLGGKFIGGPAQYLYVDTARVAGRRLARVRVTNLGNQFSTDSVTVYTNFTFNMDIALDGSQRGILISGEGQETAYPVLAAPNSQCVQPVLQRQFSIRLK